MRINAGKIKRNVIDSIALVFLRFTTEKKGKTVFQSDYTHREKTVYPSLAIKFSRAENFLSFGRPRDRGEYKREEQEEDTSEMER